MREFFQARTADIRKELERRQPFRDQYFTPDCHYDSRAESIERSENETILRILDEGPKAMVFTEQVEPSPKLRYHLKQNEQRWLIECVNMECNLCRGTNGKCTFCHGTGWIEFSKEKIKFLQEKLRSKNPL
jgi:hypothetical protein